MIKSFLEELDSVIAREDAAAGGRFVCFSFILLFT